MVGLAWKNEEPGIRDRFVRYTAESRALVQRIEIPGECPRDRIDLCKSPVGHW